MALLVHQRQCRTLKQASPFRVLSGMGLPWLGSTTSSAQVSRRAPLLQIPLPFPLPAATPLPLSLPLPLLNPLLLGPLAGGGSLEALCSSGGAGGGAPSSGDGRGLVFGLLLVLLLLVLVLLALLLFMALVC